MKVVHILAIASLYAYQVHAQSVDSLKIKINGVNLSEDMSTLSSKNDEMLLFLYDYSDTTALRKAFVSEYFVLDSAHREKEIHFVTTSADHPVLLFLVEQDTDRSPDKIELIFRKNFRPIMLLYHRRDRIGLGQITGDDDVMGVRILPTLNKKINFSFSGRYKLDKYSYLISIDKL